MVENKKKRTHVVLVAYVVLSYGITWTFSIIAISYLLPFQFPAFIEDLASVVLHYSPWCRLYLSFALSIHEFCAV